MRLFQRAELNEVMKEANDELGQLSEERKIARTKRKSEQRKKRIKSKKAKKDTFTVLKNPSTV